MILCGWVVATMVQEVGDSKNTVPLALALVLTAGCGDELFVVHLDAAHSSDATSPAPDAGTRTSPTLPGAPASPALPTWPCPAGWSEVPSIGCEPWPGEIASCPANEVLTPGDSSCAALGTACPSGSFATPRPGEVRDWFVRPGASGDGSENDPFGTISEALSIAGPGETIFLGRGTFEETVVLTQSVALIGTCPSGTRLEPSASSPGPTVTVAASGVELRDLSIQRGG